MKNAVLSILILVSMGRIWAGPIVFGDVQSQIASDFMNMVKASADQDEIFTWFATDVFPVIQITDQGPIDLAEGTQTMVSVSLGFSEDDDEPQTLAFGTFYMYAPLKTMVFLLDDSKKQQSLSEAMSLLDSAAENLSLDFFELYETGHWERIEASIQMELNSFAAYVIQWYLTPRSQGGAGNKLSDKNKGDLAAFMGFESDYTTSRQSDLIFNIVDVKNDVVILGGSISGYNDGPLYFAEIWPASRRISIFRNPKYPRD